MTCRKKLSPGTRFARATTAASVVVLAILLAAPAGAPAQAATGSRAVDSAFARMQREVATAPRRALSTALRRSLRRGLSGARAAARQGQPCAALARLLRVQRRLELTARRGRSRAVASRLHARGARIAAVLVTQPGAARCGGGKASTRTAVKTRLLSSTPNGVRLSVDLPKPTMTTVEGGGRSFTQVTMPGVEDRGTPGQPSVPLRTESYAIPNGATMSVKVLEADSYTVPGVTLAPAQRSPLDTFRPPYRNPPFVQDRGAYASNTSFPAKVATAESFGTARDMRIGQTTIAGAQYQPRSQSLRVYTHLDIAVTFSGGERTYGEARTGSVWEMRNHALYSGLVKNWRDVSRHLPPPRPISPCGEELLVVTTTALEAAADTLASSRERAGISTRVVTTDGVGGIGATAKQVQDYVRSRLNSKTCARRPSFLLILGDTDSVPTWLPDNPIYDPSTDNPDQKEIATDLPYATSNDADLLPDLAVGRIPTSDVTIANRIVAKIVRYEETPPVLKTFYDRVTIASYFQAFVDDSNWTGKPSETETRTFIDTSERIRSALVNLGKDVRRVYTTEQSNPAPDPKKSQPVEGTGARDLPAELKKPTFGWNGSAEDVVARWNDGPSIILHRGHGLPDGWGDPDVRVADVRTLTNGDLLPVIFSVNCSSARYDGGVQSFMEEALEREGGGGVGGLGDSRDSPSWANSHLTLGAFDAMFPRTLSARGTDNDSPVTALGQVLNAGKLWMDANSTGAARSAEHLLWGQAFGDPSMDVRIGGPVVIPSIRFKTKVLDPNVIELHDLENDPIAQNQFATLLVNGEVAGRSAMTSPGATTTITSDREIGSRDRVVVVVDGDVIDPSPIPVQEPARRPFQLPRIP